MKKFLLALIICSLALSVVACSNNSKIQVTNNINNIQTENIKTEEIRDEAKVGLVGEIKGENIKLYSNKKSNGMYENLKLVVNDKVLNTSWRQCENREIKLYYQDINNDNAKEVIIILCEGAGTGVDYEKIHVLNSDTLKEIDVENPKNIINEKVKSDILDENIEITINDEKTQVPKPKLEYFHHLYEQPGYGGIEKYDIVNNQIEAEIGVQVAPAVYIGSIIISYGFKDNLFSDESVKFQPN